MWLDLREQKYCGSEGAATHTWLNENGVVSDFMRNFMEQNGKRCEEPDGVSGKERSSYGQPIGEVVEKVSKQIQIASNSVPVSLGILKKERN